MVLVFCELVLDPVDQVFERLAGRAGEGLAFSGRLGCPPSLILLGDLGEVDLAAESGRGRPA